MSIQKSKMTLLDEISALMRREHYSLSTERTYCAWVRQFIKFHPNADARNTLCGTRKKVEDFLNYLALEKNVAASTQNQAFNALVFLYKRVLESPLENVKATRSRKEARIPVVLREPRKTSTGWGFGGRDMISCNVSRLFITPYPNRQVPQGTSKS